MPNEKEYITLSSLNNNIRQIIEQNFKNLSYWVIADVTNHSFKEKTNYHYFDLVEKSEESNTLIAKISGKAWGTGSNKIKLFETATGQKFTNNINVLLKVKVDYHVVFGISLEVIDIDINFTIGVIELQRQNTLAALLEKNPDVITKVGNQYVTRNSKLPLPKVIQYIAVVSSKTSAGNEDFKHTLLNNPYKYRFEIDDYHTVVQNDANASIFLERLIDVFKSNKPYDVVVINRGGGAQTDFMIFDNYRIGLAVARFPIPIITGIGHQKNETIVDLMAHTQTKTPTKAAEFIITHNKIFEDEVASFQNTIIIKSQQIFLNHFQNLSSFYTSVIGSSNNLIGHFKDSLSQINQVVVNKSTSILFRHRSNLSLVASTMLTKPKIITSNKLNDLTNTLNNIKSFKSSYLRNQQGYLNHHKTVINLISPKNILKKGFAVIKKNGVIISKANQVSVGDEMEIIFNENILRTLIKDKKHKHGDEFNI